MWSMDFCRCCGWWRWSVSDMVTKWGGSACNMGTMMWRSTGRRFRRRLHASSLRRYGKTQYNRKEGERRGKKLQSKRVSEFAITNSPPFPASIADPKDTTIMEKTMVFVRRMFRSPCLLSIVVVVQEERDIIPKSRLAPIWMGDVRVPLSNLRHWAPLISDFV